ncbi:MAG: hypothetical protein ACXADC_04685 [Candidatus Thorarchaeota archaeon]|jgi:hydroxymethylglutaryl-CoA reductase (NADPH)
MKIPPSILKRLYVKNSLANQDDGFSFKIKNSLSNGTATGMAPVTVDGNEYPLDAILVKSPDGEVAAAEVTESSTFLIKVGVEVEIYVKADPLPAGPHTIGISFQTKEIGGVEFEVDDEI